MINYTRMLVLHTIDVPIDRVANYIGFGYQALVDISWLLVVILVLIIEALSYKLTSSQQ